MNQKKSSKKMLGLLLAVLLICAVVLGAWYYLQSQGFFSTQEHPKAPALDYLDDLDIPDYDGKPYITIHDGQPFFDTSVITAESYEIYYDLDWLGRCTLADSVVGKDLMPTSKRESISSVKPTGWHSDKYPGNLVDGNSLYNRCHLIAFGLTGENANKYNLVTGTRYFNTKGVNDFENMVIDYIRETGNHVRYRVTPVWTGNNLICDGQVMEGWSVEDGGEDICFCIYAYNIQPGIIIDYATGDNHLDESYVPSSNSNSHGSGNSNHSNQTSSGENSSRQEYSGSNSSEEIDPADYLLEEDMEGTFVLNTKKMKIHTENCQGAQSLSDKNKQVYTGGYNELILQGYLPDTSCIHFYLSEHQ